MRLFFAAAVSSVALLAGAVAQDIAPTDGADEVSELDRLSRSIDDIFGETASAANRRPVSVIMRALNKITARYTDIEINMNEIARFGSLEIQPRFCDKRPPEEFPETTAFLEIFDLDYQERPESFTSSSADEAPETDGYAVEEIKPIEVAEPEPDPLEQILDEAPAPVSLVPAPEVLSGPQAEGTNIFRGWMFASSPALNALEHPVYDVWVIDCKTEVADN